MVAKRDVILFKGFSKRDCILKVMAWHLQPYRSEPERVPNPEDGESENENEEVNDGLEGTF